MLVDNDSVVSNSKPTSDLRTADLVRADALARGADTHRTIAQLLLQRGIETAADAVDFLRPTLSGLTAPTQMVDRELAARRLADAIRRGEQIVVFGDYDVDGMTSATILSEVLAALGGQVATLCAARFDGGYGLSEPALTRCLALKPAVLVTCDCGSSDHARVAAATEAGVDVVVVDHHRVPSEPLPALAFLNPHRPDCAFAYKGLCSAGLALSIGAAVRAELGRQLDMRQWLDLVALGTVADLAPLDGDNRRLTRAGLLALSARGLRPGLAALRTLAKLPAGAPVTATDIAFRFAPRLNAPGRLGSPELALRLLRARDGQEAQALAQQIEELNQQRKALSHEMANEALAQVREVYGEAPTHGVVLASPDWHRGIVGITAARVAEEFQVPALVIAFDGQEGHGSGRTPEGFDLHKGLAACAGELLGWGGHEAAVGFGLRTKRLDALRASFAEASRSYQPAPATTHVDLELGAGFDVPPLAQLYELEPLGQSNPVPQFRVHATVIQKSTVGAASQHLKLELQVGGTRMRAFAPGFGGRCASLPAEISPVGELQADRWLGNNQPELLIRQL